MHSIKSGESGFEDFRVNVKIRLSALWTSVTLCYLYGDYFELYVPQKTLGLVNGQNLLDSPMKLFAASILLVIPALMVVLSILLKPAINRPLNIVFGIVYTIIMVLIAFTSITPWRAFYVFLALVESGLTTLVVIHAWNWTKIKVINP